MTHQNSTGQIAPRERYASAFFSECFIDELARAAWRDPVQYRREMLPASSRLRRVLDQAAKVSGWSRPLPAGRARGIALTAACGAVAAHVAELSIDDQGESRVHRIVAVLDCGIEHEAELARLRFEGSLRERWAMLQPPPAVEVHVMPSEARVAAGEVPHHGLAPAMANALAVLRGREEFDEVAA